MELTKNKINILLGFFRELEECNVLLKYEIFIEDDSCDLLWIRDDLNNDNLINNLDYLSLSEKINNVDIKLYILSHENIEYVINFSLLDNKELCNNDFYITTETIENTNTNFINEISIKDLDMLKRHIGEQLKILEMVEDIKNGDDYITESIIQIINLK